MLHQRSCSLKHGGLATLHVVDAAVAAAADDAAAGMWVSAGNAADVV